MVTPNNTCKNLYAVFIFLCGLGFHHALQWSSHKTHVLTNLGTIFKYCEYLFVELKQSFFRQVLSQGEQY